MKDKRFWFGVVMSVAWIGLAIYFLFTKSHPSELNSWGDFIAGFSAPLAFLWLVLGYVQQGEELKNNTKALELQAKELKLSTDALNLQAQELRNSVEQQMHLVAATREQIEMDREVIADERRRLKDSARPKFVAIGEGRTTSGSDVFHSLKVINIGRVATNVQFSPGGGSNANPQLFPIFGSDQHYRARPRYTTDAEFKILVTYTDSDNEAGAVEIELTIFKENLQYGKFKVVA